MRFWKIVCFLAALACCLLLAGCAAVGAAEGVSFAQQEAAPSENSASEASAEQEPASASSASEEPEPPYSFVLTPNAFPLSSAGEYRALLQEADGRTVVLAQGDGGWVCAFAASAEAEALRDAQAAFTETAEGHLYDGVIAYWVLFPDGTAYGSYASPVSSVPEPYSGLEGRDYGVLCRADASGGNLDVTAVYGFLPEGVSAFAKGVLEEAS